MSVTQEKPGVSCEYALTVTPTIPLPETASVTAPLTVGCAAAAAPAQAERMSRVRASSRLARVRVFIASAPSLS